jgi:hypothetical protein
LIEGNLRKPERSSIVVWFIAKTVATTPTTFGDLELQAALHVVLGEVHFERSDVNIDWADLQGLGKRWTIASETCSKPALWHSWSRKK